MSILSSVDNEEALGRGLEAWWLTRHPDSKFEIVDVKAPSDSNGYSNEIVKLDVIRAGRREDHILRLPPSHTSLFPTYDLERQYAFMHGLEGAKNLPMPKCYGYERDKSFLGRPFIVMEYVAGDIPSDQPQFLQEGWVLDATDEQRSRMWLGSIGVITALSHVPLTDQMLAEVDWPVSAETRLEKLLTHYQGLINWAAERSRPIDFPLLDELGVWLRRNAPPESEPSIVWGDGRPGNIIYRDFEPIALLDWELAYIGDPSADLCWMLIMQRYYERQLMMSGKSGKRLGGFLSDGESLEQYNRQAQQPIENYRYFWLLSAYRFAAITQRFCGMLHEFGAMTEAEMTAMRRCPHLIDDIEAVFGDENHDALFGE